MCFIYTVLVFASLFLTVLTCPPRAGRRTAAGGAGGDLGVLNFKKTGCFNMFQPLFGSFFESFSRCFNNLFFGTSDFGTWVIFFAKKYFSFDNHMILKLLAVSKLLASKLRNFFWLHSCFGSFLGNHNTYTLQTKEATTSCMFET